MPETRLKAIELFGGVGGFSLGAARAGLELAAVVENDSHAVAAHKANFPCVAHVESDINDLTPAEILAAAKVQKGDPVALIGGPPCQGFSVMGYRCADDPRNRLFYKFFELVRDIQPVFYVAENVPGIMHPENDALRARALDLVRNDYVLMDPSELAANRHGAPTTRTRYFFIGYKDSHFSAITSDIFSGVRCRVTVRTALRGLPLHIRSNWQTADQSWRKVVYPPSCSKFWLSARSRIPKGVGEPVALQRLAEESLVSGFLGTKHSAAIKKRYARVKPAGVDKISKARRLEWNGFCPTLRAGTGPDKGSYQAVRPIHPSANRVITPREAARLQGFPDWFQFSPTKWHSFRQIGNSVCPIVAETVIAGILSKQRQ